MNNIFAQLLGGTAATTSPTANTTPSSNTNSATTPNLGAGLFGSSSQMQDYAQQILQNPRQLESMLNTPYMQSALQMMANNPEMARMMIDSNPMFANNPELREQMTRTMPTMLQQLQNPEMRNLLTNPDALQAMMQIQQGMSRLQQVAPGNDLLSGYVSYNSKFRLKKKYFN
jgi:ubiquilin